MIAFYEIVDVLKIAAGEQSTWLALGVAPLGTHHVGVTLVTPPALLLSEFDLAFNVAGGLHSVTEL